MPDMQDARCSGVGLGLPAWGPGFMEARRLGVGSAASATTRLQTSGISNGEWEWLKPGWFLFSTSGQAQQTKQQ